VKGATSAPQRGPFEVAPNTKVGRRVTRISDKRQHNGIRHADDGEDRRGLRLQQIRTEVWVIERLARAPNHFSAASKNQHSLHQPPANDRKIEVMKNQVSSPLPTTDRASVLVSAQESAQTFFVVPRIRWRVDARFAAMNALLANHITMY
jgi:hypothetical protein